MSISDIRNINNTVIQRDISQQNRAGEMTPAQPKDGFKPGETPEKSFSYSARDMAGVLFDKSGVSTKPEVVWQKELDGSVESRPVLRDGILYCSGSDNKIRAVDPQTGKEKWAFEAESSIRFSPLFDKNGTMFVFTNYKVYAVDTKNWESSWEVKLGGYLPDQPIMGEDGNIYYGESQNTYSLDTKFGIKKQLSHHSSCSPVVGNDGNLIVGGGSCDVFKIDKTTGKEFWRFHRENSSTISMPAQGPDNTVCFGTMDGSIYALDGDTGETKWSKSSFFGSGQFSNSPAFSKDGKTVYFGGADGNLTAFDTNSGRVKWRTKLGDFITTIPTPDGNGKLYAGTIDGNFCKVNEKNGKIEKTFTAGKAPARNTGDNMISSEPLIDENGTAFFGCRDKTLYAVNFDPTKSTGLKKAALDGEIADRAKEETPETPASQGIQHEGAFVIIGGVRIPVRKKG